MYPNDIEKRNTQQKILLHIVEKITGKPCDDKATFSVEPNVADPSNYLIGKTTLNEIMQLTLNQYSKKNNE